MGSPVWAPEAWKGERDKRASEPRRWLPLPKRRALWSRKPALRPSGVGVTVGARLWLLPSQRAGGRLGRSLGKEVSPALRPCVPAAKPLARAPVQAVHKPAQLALHAWEGGQASEQSQAAVQRATSPGPCWRRPALPFQLQCGQWRSRGSLAPFWKALGDEDEAHQPPTLEPASGFLWDLPCPTLILTGGGGSKGWEWRRSEEGGGCQRPGPSYLEGPGFSWLVGDQMGPGSLGCPWTGATQLPH